MGVWGQDEHRLGLKPVVRRRVWTLRRSRPLAVVHHRYRWLYVYGFVRPATGRTFWLILPTVNKELFRRALSEFAKAVGVDEKKRVVLVLDRAGWHPKSEQEMELPEGLHILPLPSYSPELQPTERLWPLVDEPVANRHFEDLDALEEVQNHKTERNLHFRALLTQANIELELTRV